jgi:hypothetical protein
MEILAAVVTLLIPVIIFVVAGFKAWRKETTKKIARRVLRKHPEAQTGGIAIRKFGIVLFEIPVCAATLRLYGVK